MSFEQLLEEQVEAQHRHIIDSAPDDMIQVNHVPKRVKRVWVGEEDGYLTYWNPDTYEEVEPDKEKAGGG